METTTGQKSSASSLSADAASRRPRLPVVLGPVCEVTATKDCGAFDGETENAIRTTTTLTKTDEGPPEFLSSSAQVDEEATHLNLPKDRCSSASSASSSSGALTTPNGRAARSPTWESSPNYFRANSLHAENARRLSMSLINAHHESPKSGVFNMYTDWKESKWGEDELDAAFGATDGQIDIGLLEAFQLVFMIDRLRSFVEVVQGKLRSTVECPRRNVANMAEMANTMGDCPRRNYAQFRDNVGDCPRRNNGCPTRNREHKLRRDTRGTRSAPGSDTETRADTGNAEVSVSSADGDCSSGASFPRSSENAPKPTIESVREAIGSVR